MTILFFFFFRSWLLKKLNTFVRFLEILKLEWTKMYNSAKFWKNGFEMVWKYLYISFSTSSERSVKWRKRINVRILVERICLKFLENVANILC